jgi:glycosyltransferase involved in cell wall biosynthesis
VKVAIVSDYYYPQLGGITEHVHGQASELARRGHDVTVLTPRLAIAPKALGLPLLVAAQGLPDLAYILLASGVLALCWGIIRTALAYSVVRRAGRRQTAAQAARARPVTSQS